jgi:endonuclease YncB( thermonuclease family)
MRNLPDKKRARSKIKAAIIALISIIGLGAFHKELLPIANCLADYIAALLFHSAALPSSITAVHDGDTFSILSEYGEIRIRLYGIDAPELKQPHGQIAKDYLSTLIEGKVVFIEVADIDRYGRSVAIATVDNESINLKMLETGNAWYYNSYCERYFCRRWEKAANIAKENKRGLWKDEKAIPPWQFRSAKR